MCFFRRRKTAEKDSARFLDFLKQRQGTDADPEKRQTVNDLTQAFEQNGQKKVD